MESIVSQNNCLKSIKKRAFSLPEILVTIMIVAMLTVATIEIIKHQEDKAMTMLYAKAYKTLRTACYNIQREVVIHNEQEQTMQKEYGSAYVPKYQQFPLIEKSSYLAKPWEICVAIADRLNTPQRFQYKENGGSCPIFSVNSWIPLPATFSLKDAEPSIITNDNMRWYFTDFDSPFVLVFVDLNGTRSPNTPIFKSGKKMADTVPFLVYKANGDVIPVGYPTYDKNYLTARVKFTAPDRTRDYSQVMTFALAKMYAYQGVEFSLDAMSVVRPQSLPIETFLQNTYERVMLRPPSTSSSDWQYCKNTGYNRNTQYPPCSVEVNTKIR